MTFTSIDEYEQCYYPAAYAKRKRDEEIEKRGLLAVLIDEALARARRESSHES